MTVEQRIEALERELATLRGKPVVYASNVYARQAFKEKYKVSGKNNTPNRYIDTEDKAAEYVGLFKEFLDIYQRYLQQ